MSLELTFRKSTKMSFNSAHMLLALIILSQRHMGRYELAKELDLTDSSTRTLLKKLRERKLVKITSKRRGHTLTRKGKRKVERFASYLKMSFIKLDLKDVTIAKSDALVLIHGPSFPEKLDTVQIRDDALKAGAKGCTTFVYTGNGLRMPEPKDSQFGTIEDDLLISQLKLLKPRNGDIILAGSAETYKKARLGAIFAAISFLERIGVLF